MKPASELVTFDQSFQFGYLLSWLLLFTCFESTAFNYKSKIIDLIREDEINVFLEYITTKILGFDTKLYDFTNIYIESINVDEQSIEILSSHLYYKTLVHLSSLYRIYYSSPSVPRQKTLSIER